MICYPLNCGGVCFQKSLEFDDLGPKRIADLEREAEGWRERAEDAVSSIQDITVNYFVETSKALAGMMPPAAFLKFTGVL